MLMERAISTESILSCICGRGENDRRGEILPESLAISARGIRRSGVSGHFEAFFPAVVPESMVPGSP